MSITFDPLDDSKVIIQNAAVGEFGHQRNDVVIGNIHPSWRCAGRPCVIHAPSDHHMRDWPLNWRDDEKQMERLCPDHAVGHPDPDDLAFQVSIGRGWMATHGCCGCCRLDQG
jgi:hypothetical protein